MKKVYVNVTVKIILLMEDENVLSEVLNESDYQITSDDAMVLDTELVGYELIDAK